MGWGKRPRIRLNSGLEVYLDCLFQYRTYAGLLEGQPTRRLNARLIQRALEYAADKLWMGGTPHLLTPPEVAIGAGRDESISGNLDHADEPATLPPIVCLGTFESFAPARHPDADCSSLRVVWFQEEFGEPVEAAVLEQLQAIDWKTVATDGYW
ncbi:MAG: hypothetical protein RIC55_05055 [Pirellulaceae bacterium]